MEELFVGPSTDLVNDGGLWDTRVSLTFLTIYNNSPRSKKTALGTCLPDPVSLKKVLKLSSDTEATALSLGSWPSGWIPCSMQ